MSVFSAPENRILQDLLEASDPIVFENLLKKLDINVVLDRIRTNPEHLNEFELADLKNRLIKYSHDTQNASLEKTVNQAFANVLGPPPTPQQSTYARGAFGASSEEQIVLIARTLIGLDEGRHYNKHKDRIFRAIAAIPDQERESVIALALPQIRAISDPYARANILEALAAIPREHRKSLVDLIVFIFTPTGDDATPENAAQSADMYSYTLETLLQIPNDQIVPFLNRAAGFLKDSPTLASRFTVVSNFVKIPPAEFLNVMHYGLPLFLRMPHTSAEKATILGAIGQIPAEERQEVLDCAAPVLQVIQEAGRRAQILEVFKVIPTGQRADVIKQTISLVPLDPEMEKRKETGSLIGILLLLGSTPPGERGEIVALLTAAIQAMPNDYSLFAKWNLLRGIITIPQKDRKRAMDSIAYLFSRGVSGGEEARIAEAIAAIPKNERADKLLKAMPLIRQGPHEKNWVLILETIPYFALGELDEVLADLSIDGALNARNKFVAIQWILEEHLSLAESTRAYLFTQLQSLNDPVEVRNLAVDICENQSVFGVHEDHSLVQEAISKIAITERTNDPKNPYQLYMKLKAMDAKPLPVVKTPVEVIDEVIDGKRYALNAEGFQENAARAVPITFAQVPQNVGPNDLKKLFAAFAARLAQMKPEASEAVLKYIKDTTETPLEALQTNFADDAYLNSLLRHPRGNPADTAPVDVARFFALMNFILSQSSKVEPGQLLSLQEEVLLKMSASIQACKKGKSEGVALAYNALDSKFRYDKAQAGAEGARDFLAKVVQEELSNALSADNSMMRELAGSPEPITQLAHQTIYLKNFIGRAIGLPHPLEFDPYTGVLSNELIERDLQDTLDIFYKHVTPKMLAAALQKQVNRGLKEKTVDNLFGKLNGFLGNTLGNWEMDEDEIEVLGLSEKGALDLLVRAGYLTQA